MKPLKSHYPEFVPNQILTNTQLNQLRDHLDRQDQLSRVRLAGTGIVCGLTWSIDGAGAIVLDEGYGVTSGGHLVEVAETVFTHAVAYVDPGVDEEGDIEYEAWRDAAGGQIDLLELLDAAAVAAWEDPDPQAVPPAPLGAAHLQDRVLVLYLEQRPVHLRSCIVTDCNNTGTNIHLEVRALLVRRGDLDALVDCPPAPAPERLPRFHTHTRLTDLGSAAEIDAAWRDLAVAALPGLAAKVRAAFAEHGPFLGLDVDVESGVQGLEQFVAVAAAANELHQSHHDVLDDLADALNEAVAAAWDLEAECCPASTFPRHLMLGDPDPALDPFGFDAYRHEFRPSPFADVMGDGLERVFRLFLRLAAMLDARDPQSFDRGVPGTVALTPSRTAAEPLGRRAVPRSYTLTPEIERHWQPRLCSTTEPLWSYHRPGAFDADLRRASFLRIEGHLGHPRDAALAAITGLRRSDNVAFDVLAARFGDPASEQQPFHARLGALLADRGVELAGLETFFLESARDETIDDADVTRRVVDTSAFDRTLDQESAAQAALLADWEPWCDPAVLFAGFRAARGELGALLHRLLGELAKTPDSFYDPSAYDPGEVPAARARMMLADRKLARLLAIGAAGGDVAGAVQPAREEIVALKIDVAPWVLLPPAAESLRTSIGRLLRGLPESPEGLGVEVFLERLRSVWADALYFWLLWKAADALPEDQPIGAGREDDPGDWVLPVLASGAPARLVELTLAYEALRHRDLGWFVNLAAAADGLEHRGGVVPGGTFVLVIDDTDGVCADFSLPGRLPCCCEIDPATICRPPLALPDHRVVALRRRDDGSGFKAVEVLVDVLANDSDPNDPLTRDRFAVELPGPTSALGGDLDQPSAGVVRYRHSDPRPGCVDRFRYTLRVQGGPCPGAATADVLVLTVAEPEPEPGTIVGRVASADGDAAIFDARIEVVDTGGQDATDEDGRYAFTDLAENVYELRATHPDFLAATRTAAVPEGTTVAVDFLLEPVPEPGSITGRVASAADDSAIDGARVRILETGREEIADENGLYTFAAVPEGVYRLRATHASFIGATRTAVVPEGATVAVDFALLMPQAGDETGNIIVTVIDDADIQIAGARVGILDASGSLVSEGTTGGDGEVVLAGIPTGADYEVSAKADGHLTRNVAGIAVTAGADVQVSIRLRRVRRLTVTVIDLDSRRQTNELVRFRSVAVTFQVEDFTGPEGEVVFPEVPIGRYEVSAIENDVAVETREGAIIDSADNFITLTVPRVSIFSGSILAERHLSRSEAMAALEPAVGTSAAYQNATTFLAEALVAADQSEVEVVTACQETLKSLSAAIVRVDAERQAALREAVLLVDAGCLDRVVSGRPEALEPELRSALATMAELTRKTGVTTDQLLEAWGGERLADELGATSVDAVREVIGGGA